MGVCMGKSKINCDCNVLHNDVVKMYKKGFSNNELVLKLGNLFHLLSDNTRLSILTILDDNEVCVSDIACILDMTKSAVSHQLKVLKDAGVVECRKNGKETFYLFSNSDIKKIIEIAIGCITK